LESVYYARDSFALFPLWQEGSEMAIRRVIEEKASCYPNDVTLLLRSAAIGAWKEKGEEEEEEVK